MVISPDEHINEQAAKDGIDDQQLLSYADQNKNETREH